MVQWLTNSTRNHEVAGLVPGLGLRIRSYCELWCSLQMWLRSGLLWLWLITVASIRPLAWELPYAAGMVLKRQKKRKKEDIEVPLCCSGLKIQHCHSCNTGCNCSVGSSPGPESSICPRCSLKNIKRKKRQKYGTKEPFYKTETDSQM